MHGDSVTRVDPDSFVLPVRRIGVSGGTAPFFRLKLKRTEDKSVDYYIGKDLSHATDEIGFYEKVLLLKKRPGANEDLLPLLDFAFEYAGVLDAWEEGFREGDASLELLVLRNLYDGKKKLRLLDLKMGPKTAQAGWQGKTRMRAMKQGVVDALSNSTVEGFRLEGFDGCPGSLASKEPIVDAIPLCYQVGKLTKLSSSLRPGDGIKKMTKLSSSLRPSDGTKKKMNRMMLQTLKGAEVFQHFVDLHLDFDREAKEQEVHRYIEPIEVAELVLHEVVERLTRLLLACYMASVPQKWIGSSVALGYEAGHLPERGGMNAEEEIRSNVLVNIFDWGRSELNTIEAFNNMNEKEKGDRKKFWKLYTNGIRSLSWNAACEYWNRFGNVFSWEKVRIRVYDYDSTSKDDFMCQAAVPVVETTKETWIPLKGRIVGLKVKGTLSYSFEWHDAPYDSRMKGWFRLHIGEGKDLPRRDKVTGGKSDPYCIITAKSSCGKHEFSQTTSTIVQNLNPEWDENFYLPILKDGRELTTAVEKGCGCTGLSSARLDSFFGVDFSGPESWGGLLQDLSLSAQ